MNELKSVLETLKTKRAEVDRKIASLEAVLGPEARGRRRRKRLSSSHRAKLSQAAFRRWAAAKAAGKSRL